MKRSMLLAMNGFRPWVGGLLMLTVSGLVAGCQEELLAPVGGSLEDRLAALGATPCPEDESFSCAFVDVPLNHAEPDGTTLSLAIAVRPADGPSEGVLVLIDGGPGYAGIDGTDDLSELSPEFAARFDLLYFDLRGVSRSAGIDCVAASDAFYAEGFRVSTPAERAEVAGRARDFSADCPAETGWSLSELALLNTAQAAEDLEAVRVALGAPPITVYGLSYGTQLAQTYVSAHPQAVRAVALDGALDLTRPMLDYDLGVVKAVNDNLARVFAWCAEDVACSQDLPDAGAAYDQLRTELAQGPVSIAFPLPDGSSREREFKSVNLDHFSSVAMDDEFGRAAFLRGLAAAAKGQWVPLRQLVDVYEGLDPATEQVADDGFSDAIYYTFTCNDYGLIDEQSYLDQCAEKTEGQRSTDGCYGDLPCASWPTAAEQVPRPAPFAPEGIPVLVINADADVATPVEQGRSLVSGLKARGFDAFELAVAGGHHVMWGSDECVNVAVTDYLLDPASLSADVACDPGLVAEYLPLTSSDPADYAVADDFLAALMLDLYALPDFPLEGVWSCNQGGGVSADFDGTLTLERCSFVDQVFVDGTGSYDAELDQLELVLTVSGAHNGQLVYLRGPEQESLSGTWDGTSLR